MIRYANGTIAPPKAVSITGITAGSRLQIYNVTTATEMQAEYKIIDKVTLPNQPITRGGTVIATAGKPGLRLA